MTACLPLDDYLDGRLSEADAQAFEAHALDCAACDAALESSVGDLSVLRDVSCPPAVVEAALRSARRAGDRAPAAGRGLRRRFVWAPLALAAALAVVVGVSLDREPVPVVAEATAPVAPTESAETTGDVDRAETPVPPPEADPVAPAPRPTPAPQTPQPDPRPAAPQAPAVAPTSDIAQAVPDVPDEAEPTTDEIEAARQDLALAFRLVAEAQSRAGDAVRAEAGPLSHTLDQTLPF
ncbi:zf-HC2 domain-containing protein [Rubrivirga sp.]|uniref:zf-HC2 domain-containing protein n=1 Tax=Rubrivirga sp. TaxID=1885344 RepID=UPI003B51B930